MGAFPIKVIDPLWHLYTYSSCFQWKEKAFYKPILWGVSKKNWKTKKIKKKLKKPNCEKNLIKSIKILKKPTGSVWFGFINLKLNRTEPKPEKNQAKQEKTEPNWFAPVFILKNRTEPKPVSLNQFQFGFKFFKKNSIYLLFFNKNRIKLKIITSIYR